YGGDTDFEVIQPLNVLSENMTPKQWNILLETLGKIDFESYAGVVITHGSDTLAYTSALIGMLYGKAGVPIPLIAANYPLENPKSNGINNFHAAISFIKNEGLPGVYVFYEDNDGVMQVYLSTRIVEADCYADQFQAFGGKALGYMKEGRFIRNEEAYNPKSGQLKKFAEQISEAWAGQASLRKVRFTENILLIRSYPGLNYSFYNWNTCSHKPKAVLVALYHSATACVSDDGKGEYSLVEFARRCRKEGIDIYASSFKSEDMKFYASINTFLEAGIVPMCNISTEAAYMKLMISYNMDSRAALEENMYFEELPPV
ncbi:MAG: asparaginase domain-containing protein, partial [Eubacteriales bacterium]|nr:asparaginase domain-containing protein [Eubacteriales bacterium]